MTDLVPSLVSRRKISHWKSDHDDTHELTTFTDLFRPCRRSRLPLAEFISLSSTITDISTECRPHALAWGSPWRAPANCEWKCTDVLPPKYEEDWKASLIYLDITGSFKEILDRKRTSHFDQLTKNVMAKTRAGLSIYSNIFLWTGVKRSTCCYLEYYTPDRRHMYA